MIEVTQTVNRKTFIHPGSIIAYWREPDVGLTYVLLDKSQIIFQIIETVEELQNKIAEYWTLRSRHA